MKMTDYKLTRWFLPATVSLCFMVYFNDAFATIVIPSVDTTKFSDGIINHIGAARNDYDAARFDQLKATSASLGGGANYNSDGTYQGPNYKVSGANYNNVGEAVSALDNKLEKLEGGGLIKQNATTMQITIGSDKKGGEISMAGTDGSRKLSGVANGTAANDAATKGQVDGAAAELTENINNLKQTIKNGGLGLVKQNPLTQSITVAEDKDGKDVSFAGALGDRVLTGVADGVNPNDAVNKRQLSLVEAGISSIKKITENININTTSTAVGVGAQAGQNGTAVGSNAHAGQDSTAVGANSTASGSNSVAIGKNSTASGSNSVALGANSVADRDNSVSIGSAGHERQLTNVADGTFATDAVNVRQLKKGVDEARRDSNRGTASAIAMANANPVLAPNKRFAVSMAMGTYGGQSALAGGAAIRFTENLSANVNAGASVSGGSVGVGAGMSYQW